MKNILLLEDNKLDVDLVTRELKFNWPNATITFADKIEVARKKIEETNFDIALFDLKLPDGNGLDLLVELRNQENHLPIIVFTNSGSEDIALTVLKAGANGYIPKKLGYHKTLLKEIELTLLQSVKSQKKINVLYAEHQKGDIDLTLIHFKKYAPQINVDIVFTGNDLLSKLKDEKTNYQIILLDYLLPGLTGIELTKIIRTQLNIQTPIIIVTGQGNEYTAVEALKVGVTDYIVKQQNYLLRLPSVIMNAHYNAQLKSTQEELIKSESQYKLLATNTLDAVFTTDLNLNITFVNKAVEQLFLYSVSEMIGKNGSELTTQEGLKIIQEQVELLLENKNSPETFQIRFEAPLVRKDQSIIFTEITSVILYDNNNNPIGFQGRAIDISERKRAQLIQQVILNISNATQFTTDINETFKLIQSELGKLMFAKNFYVVELNQETGELNMVYFVDEKDSFTEFPKGKTLTNYILTNGNSLLIKNKDFASFKKQNNIETIGSPSKVWLGVPLKLKGKVTGSVVIQNYTNPNAYTEKDKEILEIISHQISITLERKLYEENLKKALETAQESDRLKSAFLANMSHEIRTPMNSILGFSELLKQPKLGTEKQQLYISIIEKSGVRMLNTINDLMEISKIEAGLMKVHIAEVNINEQVEELYNVFNLEAEKKGLKLLVSKKIPLEDAIINTDSVKVVGVLSNLLKNAIKFTQKGTIEYGYYKNENYLEFFVKDTGIGIPDNRIESIFNRFEQADIEDRNAYEGSGLGLAIAKSYVKMLKGEIWVKTKENVGSIFYFKIPYLKINKSLGLPVSNKPYNLSNLEKSLTILIVEDDIAAKIFLTEVVEQFATKILYAETGNKALRVFKENPDIHLILMDIKLPGTDGYTVTQEIRKTNQNVKIIAQTAFALTGDREKALEAGCNEYISKPINREQLLNLIYFQFLA